MDSHHQLTSWGKVLETTLSASGSNKDLEEAAFLAVELLRLGLLTADTMFPGYSGAPMRGSGKNTSFNRFKFRNLTLAKRLINAIACSFLEQHALGSFAISREVIAVL